MEGTYQLVALDLDGTVLDPSGHVTPRTRRAIAQLVERGVYVCFATGRNHRESMHILAEVGHHPRCVFVGGAAVVDTAPDEGDCRLVSSVQMHAELARELCGELEALGHAVLALQESFSTGVDYVVTAEVPMNAATTLWMKLTRARVRLEPRLADFHHSSTLRVGVVSSVAEVRQIAELLDRNYGQRIVTHAIAVPAQQVEVVEVFDPEVSKWQGVLQIAAWRGVPPERVIAVGDDLNDLSMVSSAGLGVAMGNARSEVKRVAREVIGPNSRDGLAEFLESLVRQGRVTAA
ncbi:MAG: HAD family hydrolase [Tepidisphaerales bacterium]